MPDTVLVQPISPVDIQAETPGAGTLSNFTRGTSTGGTESVNKFSAAAVPVLDPPVVASARTPFSFLGAGRTVEQCLANLRINTREAKNIEHYGAVAGTGISDADAERNTQAWRKCLDDIAAEGRNNGIFGPGARYEFKDLTGGAGLYAGNILPFQTSGGANLGNLVIIGAPNTQFVAHGNATITKPLFYATGVANIIFDGIQISHRVGGVAECVLLDPSTAGIMSNIRFERVSFTNGGKHVFVDYTPASASYVKDLWIKNCIFNAAVSLGIDLQDVAGAQIAGNVFAGANTGIQVAGTGTVAFGNYEIMDNQLVNGGLAQSITITVSTFSAGIHHTVKVKDNKLSFGTIAIDDLNNLTIEGNTLFNGVIDTRFGAAMASVYDIRIRDNTITGTQAAALPAIRMSNSSTNMRRWWINNNDVYLAHGHAIYVLADGAGARLRGGEIAGNMVLDPSQAGTNTYNGITLDANNASAGISESMVLFNRMTSTNGALKMKRGIEEISGGVSDFNRYIGNMVKGWQTGAISALAAGSSDAITSGGASTTIDLGSPV